MLQLAEYNLECAPRIGTEALQQAAGLAHAAVVFETYHAVRS